MGASWIHKIRHKQPFNCTLSGRCSSFLSINSYIISRISIPISWSFCFYFHSFKAVGFAVRTCRYVLFCSFFRHLPNIYNFQFLRDKKTTKKQKQTNKQASQQASKQRKKEKKQTNKQDAFVIDLYHALSDGHPGSQGEGHNVVTVGMTCESTFLKQYACKI